MFPLAVLFLLANPIVAKTLPLRVLDEHGRPVTARLRLRDAEGRFQKIQAMDPPNPVVAHPRIPELGVLVERQAKIELLPGRATLLIDRGFEYHTEEIPIETAADQNRTVRLRRWVDLARQGWWSGDLHVHRAPAEMPALLDSADLHFAPAITRWNDRSNIDSWEGQKRYAGPRRAWSIDNSEDERPWGAALFFHLQSPIELYNGKLEYPPPTSTWEAARRAGGFIDQEKLIWWAAPVMAALIRPDSMGVLNNHFQEVEVMANEAWGRPRDQAKYPGPRGFANYVLDLYYTYLSAGFRVAASAGSANGVLRSPIGHNRSWVYLGRDFSAEAYLEAQKRGRNFVSNGPVLLAKFNGRHPGEVFPESTTELTVQVEATSIRPLERAEVVVDGAVAATIASKGQARVKVQPGSWVAVRCFERDSNTVRFAHTSPVYIGANARRSPESRRFLREWIDIYIDRVEKLPEAALTAAQKQEWLAASRRARDLY